MNITEDLNNIEKMTRKKELLELKNILEEEFGNKVNFIVGEACCYVYNNEILENKKFKDLLNKYKFNYSSSIFA